MLYDSDKGFPDKELFSNPPAKYRGAPFWAWNCKLDKEELLSQIEALKKMGFGGFFMHSRAGMGTEYLGDEFMDIVSSCVSKAKSEDMLAWLYDEDRWPSGAAGGYLTKDKKHRQKSLYITSKKEESFSFEECKNDGKLYLLACFDVSLNTDGTLKSYRKICENDSAEGKKWYVYIKTRGDEEWFNNQTYPDTLNPETMAEFIKITYDAYEKCVGDSFGNTVNAIFTDEPAFSSKQALPFAQSDTNVSLPWTLDFPQTFIKNYGFDITDYIPELVWDLPSDKGCRARYCYHNHCCERFSEAFSQQLGTWCDNHGLSLTGHFFDEATLFTQTCACGDVMRYYKYFGIPGVDILCDMHEFTTLKQAQSVKNQTARNAMLSELYGVTGWDSDFRFYKHSGDWQAALGITLRVPHLSWVSMKGYAKRDYPASFNYQAPWYKEFSVIEDHFARLNTVLTQGKPDVNVCVLHPIESAWTCFGPSESSGDALRELDHCFANITQWLLFGTIDFDYINEALLPEQYKDSKDTLNVGDMSYKCVVIPPIKTIRSSTLRILTEFVKNGGTVIFTDECPSLVDGNVSDEALELFNLSKHTAFTKHALLCALSDVRDVEIRKTDGLLTENYIYNMRSDKDVSYLFIANGKKKLQNTNEPFSILRDIEHDDLRDTVIKEDVIIKLRGTFIPTQWDTLTGEVKSMEFTHENGFTYIPHTLYAYDSLLIRLEKSEYTDVSIKKAPALNLIGELDINKNITYTLDEPNVYLLDTAMYSLDGGEFFPEEELLRADYKLRQQLGIQLADGCTAQPWVFGNKPPEHFVTLKFSVESEISVTCELAYEEMTKLVLNGTDVTIVPEGWYIDKCLHKTKLPTLKKGTNEIIITAPISESISLENYFLLGDFNVRVSGCEKVICEKNDKISFTSITNCGMPFYGGNITYSTEFEAPEDCNAQISVIKYRGALVKVFVDGEFSGNITIMPYSVNIPNLSKGKHKIEFKLFGNRFNTLGALHNCGYGTWHGPSIWYTRDYEWCYEYNLKDAGILIAPHVKFYK